LYGFGSFFGVSTFSFHFGGTSLSAFLFSCFEQMFLELKKSKEKQ
jgi:hypothetical protein